MVGVKVPILTFFRKAGVGLRLTVEKNTMADSVDAPIPLILIRCCLTTTVLAMKNPVELEDGFPAKLLGLQ